MRFWCRWFRSTEDYLGQPLFQNYSNVSEVDKTTWWRALVTRGTTMNVIPPSCPLALLRYVKVSFYSYWRRTVVNKCLIVVTTAAWVPFLWEYLPLFFSQRQACLCGSINNGHLPVATVVAAIALSTDVLSLGSPCRCHSRSVTGRTRTWRNSRGDVIPG